MDWASWWPSFSALPWSALAQPANHSHFTPDKSIYEINTCIQGAGRWKRCCVNFFYRLRVLQLLYHTWNPSFCTTGQTSLPPVPAGNAAARVLIVALPRRFIRVCSGFNKWSWNLYRRICICTVFHAPSGVPSAGRAHGMRIQNSQSDLEKSQKCWVSRIADPNYKLHFFFLLSWALFTKLQLLLCVYAYVFKMSPSE